MVYPQLQRLATAEQTSGADVRAAHDKFVQEGKAFQLKYQDISTFFGGLEAKIGPPKPKVAEAMEEEHTSAADSNTSFFSCVSKNGNGWSRE